jgi:spermine/spermidine synthase
MGTRDPAPTLSEITIRPSSDSTHRAGLELLAASFVVLFQELVLIRWLPVEVRVVGYFPNLILLSAFLGLGIGALRARGTSLLWLWPASLVTLVAAAWAMGRVAFTGEGVTEHLWLLYLDLPADAPVVAGVRLPLIALFVLSAMSFVSLGQFVGERLEEFRVRSSSLWGYSLDLSGSLLGVVLFTAVSFSGVRPIWWFASFLAVGFYLVRSDRRVRVAYVGASIFVLFVVGSTTGAERFSPYYALASTPVDGTPDYNIQANGSLHQIAIDFEADATGQPDRLKTLAGYHLPYRALGRPIRNALVLGAGTGNDVAVLLSEGAESVHAVEIDPVILELGQTLHPNRPYADPRVTVHNVDARSFLNETEERFDLIVFGTLDSMTRLSALSNVRLDNFVYTREALAAAKSRLTDDGGVVMYFAVSDDYIFEHLAALLASTFGQMPVVHRDYYTLFNIVFMAGPAYADETQIADPDAWYLQEDIVRRTVPRDDWPFLYLPSPGVNSFYLSMIALLAAISVIAVMSVSRDMRAAVLKREGIDVEMFLYGFAFLLIETKFVTGMNLLWGATWLTSAVVFGAILVTILAGTILTQLKPMRWQVAAVGLTVALLVTYLVPLHMLLRTTPAARLLLSVLFVGAPVIFAAICFAARFKARPAADLAFGWNLLGAVVGGLAEFFSMAVGFRTMTLVAMTAYLIAFVVGQRSSQVGNETPT